MKKLFIVSILSILASTSTFAANCNPIKDKEDYNLISPSTKYEIPQEKPIKIIEFFNYSCIHCYEMKPHFEQWIKNSKNKNNIQIERVALGFNKTFDHSAKLYYALLESKNLTEELHNKIFEELNKNNSPMMKKSMLKDNSDLISFLQKNNVKSPEKIIELMNSFSISTKVKQHLDLALNKYSITGTPSYVINDKYKIDGTLPIKTLEDITNKLEIVSTNITCNKK